MSIEPEFVIGWDVGGAHLKAVSLDRNGSVVRCIQLPCPLWQGLQHLELGIDKILSAGRATCHAVTMTGELVDLFANRREGVLAIAHVLGQKLHNQALLFFAGEKAFVPLRQCSDAAESIASMNWYATGQFTASRLKQALVVDIGSTTTDMILVRDGSVHAEGMNDFSRMASDELVYTGLVRTPLIALGRKIKFLNTEVGVMAEYFATSADVYRVLGELPEHADQQPAADNGAKTRHGSARRLARMIGRDVESADDGAWRDLAHAFADSQLQHLHEACGRLLARNVVAADAPLVGAGCGSFLVRKLALMLRRPYVDFAGFATGNLEAMAAVNTCAPAYSVAALALGQMNQAKATHA